MMPLKMFGRVEVLVAGQTFAAEAISVRKAPAVAAAAQKLLSARTAGGVDSCMFKPRQADTSTKLLRVHQKACVHSRRW